MPDKIISSLESQLSRLLGKKESKKMDVASGCAFSTWLKASMTELVRAAQQTCSWHWLLLYPLSAEKVQENPAGLLVPLDLVGQRSVCSSCHPSCLHTPVLTVRAPTVCPAHQPCWGVCACLTWAGKARGAGLCPATGKGSCKLLYCPLL